MLTYSKVGTFLGRELEGKGVVCRQRWKGGAGHMRDPCD